MDAVSRQRLVPTANNPRLVTRLLELVAQGVRSTRGLQEALAIDARSVQECTHAATWLGLLEDQGEVHLTADGLEYVYAGRDRPRAWYRAATKNPFVAGLVTGRMQAPSVDDVAVAVAKVEPDLSPGNVQRRASALKALLGPALHRRAGSGNDPQLVLPLAPRDAEPPPPRLGLAAGRDYNPDIYRFVYASLLDHGELTLGQLRALLDQANVSEVPIGGYVDLAVTRGEAVRADERLITSVEGVYSRDLADTTASIVLSDPGYRHYLTEIRAAASGDREAEVRLTRVRGRYRIWDRRLFGRDPDPMQVDTELRRVLLDRSLGSFPLAKGPGSAPPQIREPFLDVWTRARLPVALPPTLASLRQGLDIVNHALRLARQGAHDVAAPDASFRTANYHAGIMHPGEALPRSVPDLRTLRLRLLQNSPYPAVVAALLLLHRTSPKRFGITTRRGGWCVRVDGQDVGDLLHVVDGFAEHRQWLICRRRHGGLSTSGLIRVLESVGAIVVLGSQAVLAERFFVQLRTEPDELELHQRLAPLAETLEAWLESVAAATPDAE